MSIKTEIDTGAITGPIHGRGIKNSTSHSNIEEGQSSRTLSHT